MAEAKKKGGFKNWWTGLKAEFSKISNIEYKEGIEKIK